MLILYDTEMKSNLVRSLPSTSNPVQQFPRLVTSTLVPLVGVSGLAITNWPAWGGLKQGKTGDLVPRSFPLFVGPSMELDFHTSRSSTRPMAAAVLSAISQGE
jgi:hypothetical protein